MSGFWQAMNNYNDNPCLLADKEYSYSDLNNITNECFTNCQRSVVIIICRRDVATIIGYLAFLRKRVVPLLLPEEISQDNLKSYIERYKPKYIWGKDRDLPVAAKELPQTRFMDYQLFELDNEPYQLANELALLLTTSGTTAHPKLVRLSYANLESNSKAIVESLKISKNHRAITLLPLHYSFGLSVINSHLCAGASIVVSNNSMMQREFWHEVKDSQLTSFYGVPYHLEMLKKLNLKRLKLDSLSLVAQAGGKLSQEMKEYYFELSKELNFSFYTMYGQTEASPRISCLPPEYYEEKSESVGSAIPGGHLSISDADKNGVGEIVYQGDNVYLGYAFTWKDLALQTKVKGLLRTGDIGYLDEDGFLYITGRKKRFVKVFGNNINLDHLEALACSIEKDSVIIGQDNKIVLLTKSSAPEDIRKYILKKTSLAPMALSAKTIEQVFRMPSGKINYKKMTSQYISDDEYLATV